MSGDGVYQVSINQRTKNRVINKQYKKDRQTMKNDLIINIVIKLKMEEEEALRNQEELTKIRMQRKELFAERNKILEHQGRAILDHFDDTDELDRSILTTRSQLVEIEKKENELINRAKFLNEK